MPLVKMDSGRKRSNPGGQSKVVETKKFKGGRLDGELPVHKASNNKMTGLCNEKVDKQGKLDLAKDKLLYVFGSSEKKSSNWIYHPVQFKGSQIVHDKSGQTEIVYFKYLGRKGYFCFNKCFVFKTQKQLKKYINNKENHDIISKVLQANRHCVIPKKKQGKSSSVESDEAGGASIEVEPNTSSQSDAGGFEAIMAKLALEEKARIAEMKAAVSKLTKECKAARVDAVEDYLDNTALNVNNDFVRAFIQKLESIDSKLRKGTFFLSYVDCKAANKALFNKEGDKGKDVGKCMMCDGKPKLPKDWRRHYQRHHAASSTYKYCQVVDCEHRGSTERKVVYKHYIKCHPNEAIPLSMIPSPDDYEPKFDRLKKKLIGNNGKSARVGEGREKRPRKLQGKHKRQTDPAVQPAAGSNAENGVGEGKGKLRRKIQGKRQADPVANPATESSNNGNGAD